MTCQIRPAGDRAVLLVLDDPSCVREVAASLSATPPAGVVEIVPAAATILVLLESGASITVDDIAAITPAPRSTAPVVTIPVRYDGPDIVDAAASIGLTAEELAAAHTAVTWNCDFVGFAPGFGYLSAPDWAWTFPRRSTPRAAVPAGSVALAAGFSAVYPRSTPGGWQLIGTTDLPMFDADRTPPALITAGASVRFSAV